MGMPPVSKDEEYRNNAFDSLHLAERAETLADRLRLLQLAEAWVNLADRAQEMARRFRRTPASLQVHPLVREMLKDPRDQA
jgi:hypothetical protein